jgi:hypothetical protein
MKPFKKFLTLSEDIVESINDLCEANVHTDRYDIGSQVVLKTTKGDWIGKFNQALSDAKITKKVDGNTIFNKIEKQANLLTVVIGKDEKITTFLAFGSTEFKLVGNPDSWFNKYKSGGGISWGAPQMETAACIGLYLNGIKMAEDIADGKNVQAWKDKIVGVLNRKVDWFVAGKNSIINSLQKISVGDFNTLALLASGMTSFKKAIIPFKTIHIIHGKIGKYYAAERENPKIDVQGNKDNTADVVISDSSADETIKAMGSYKASFLKKNGLVKVGDVTLFQVSLKKSLTGAQLGKITKSILTRYDINVTTLFNTLMAGDCSSLELNTLTEGFMSWIKDMGSKVLDMFQKLYKKLKDKFSKVQNFLTSTSVWQKQAEKDEKEFQKLTGIENLAEYFICSDNEMVLNESILTEAKKVNIGNKLKDLTRTEKEKVIARVNKRLKNIQKAFKKAAYLIYKNDKLISKTPTKADGIFKLFANYVSLKVYHDMIGGGDYDDEQIIIEIIDLQKEMYFGRTELPLWKVYGALNPKDTNTYKNLGTGKDFVKKTVQRLTGKDIKLVGFRANWQKSYYTMQSSFILGTDDDGDLNYNIIRTGTNQAGKYSFIVEGTQEHDFKKFEKWYIK